MDGSTSPHQRALLESAGMGVYEAIAAASGVPADDPLVRDQPQAVALLLELGLLHLENDRYAVVDPNSVQSGIVSPLGQQGAQLIAESSQWAQTLSDLSQVYRRSPSTEDGPVTRLRGAQIDRFLAELVPSAKTEMLTAQPEGDRGGSDLKEAGARDVEALRRGVSVRTIYQHAARRSRPTRAYVARVVKEGAEVRTLDEFFNRLIVVDRAVALIPSGDDLNVALAIRDVDLVAYLVDIFERFWERGRPFESQESSTLASIAAEQRAMAIRMLIEGHSDATCAKRLGVSPRTYAAYVADLKNEFDAQTRFQLGYRMGLKGTTGTPDA
ncbi:LuxR family transcriptional regulator [Nocardioides sp. AE5]|uniref:LuxR family transcriptional regulator n=1 Tax=Nocardioides sp. AE5 TaxID=2962573 RepID=UPI002881C91B|nr:LuxR family transcriptional regulator [Nocardioides sp. AE5]MDT0202516.1 LuxR family transcriptional regulator [Nocardioides sp. AE5]